MIDEARAAEKVNAMNQANVKNLVRALAVQKYLFDIFGDKVDMAYSPETGTMQIRSKDSRLTVMRNVIESVKRAVREKPSSVLPGRHTRLYFPGGFSVVVVGVDG